MAASKAVVVYYYLIIMVAYNRNKGDIIMRRVAWLVLVCLVGVLVLPGAALAEDWSYVKTELEAGRSVTLTSPTISTSHVIAARNASLINSSHLTLTHSVTGLGAFTNSVFATLEINSPGVIGADIIDLRDLAYGTGTFVNNPPIYTLNPGDGAIGGYSTGEQVGVWYPYYSIPTIFDKNGTKAPTRTGYIFDGWEGTPGIGATLTARWISTDATLTAFSLNGVSGTITGNAIAVTLPTGTDTTALTAAYTLASTGATIAPDPSTITDYTNPVTFTVTAEDTVTTQTYTVTVTLTDNPVVPPVNPPIDPPTDPQPPTHSGIAEPFQPSKEQATPATGETLPVIRCKEWANVRTGPGTDHDIAGKVLLGEIVELIEWNGDETWCKIYFEGGSRTGWLHRRFLLK